KALHRPEAARGQDAQEHDGRQAGCQQFEPLLPPFFAPPRRAPGLGAAARIAASRVFSFPRFLIRA
ncbi:MAG: hypothetical protein II520_03100, partial [Bacilli bacterium]|nr:hypothetical protein [Bacilli bacterium]